ncbi:hypothetical protein [Kitasatospora terrestris]|uniref:2-hydroxy-acid oxidase n=1 Tax=Kitasatospora terrestris TaxID=258051 RepID=A0ABP9EA77_9ACTN
MRVSGPLPPQPAAAPLRLAAAASADFTGDSPLARDPDLRVLVSDLARPYGVALDEDALRRGRGQSYGEMAERLLAQLVPDGPDVDLLVLVYAAPDVRPGRAVAVHLAGVCPGRPLAFAVCDQGSAGTFSALRIADAYGRTGGARRALLIALEQSSLHHRPDRPARLPDRHTAAALLFETGGSHRLAAHREHTAVTTADLPAALAALTADLPADTRLHLGPGLTHLPAAATRRALPGTPFTGTWRTLATALPTPYPIALVDHDPDHGRLDLALLTPEAA